MTAEEIQYEESELVAPFHGASERRPKARHSSTKLLRFEQNPAIPYDFFS